MKKIFLALLIIAAAVAHAQTLTVYTDAAGKKGYKDDKGKIVVTARYSEATADFYMNRAKVKLGNKYGFINKRGLEVIRPQYDSAAAFTYFGTADVVTGKTRARIDTTGRSIPFDPKTFSATDFDFSDLDFWGIDLNHANPLNVLTKANVICDRFTSGSYNGEMFTDTKPGGYGCYIFADSSFYCGLSDNGAANGNGVLYDKTNSSISIGKWANGKLTGDYYVIRLNDYKVQVYSATAGAPLFRAGMQINGKYVITSNLIHPYATDKHNLISILDADGISTMFGKLDDNFQFDGNYASFDSPDEMLKINNTNHGVYVKNVTTQSYAAGSVIADAEKNLGFSLPVMLYPQKLVNNYLDKERFFGKANGSTPNGFGSISSQGSAFHLLTGMFDAGVMKGFKQEIINAKQKYFFAGDFQETYSNKKILHSGNTYAKVIYFANNDVNINIGSFRSGTDDESLLKGITVNVKPSFTSVVFISDEGGDANNGKGYLMLPGKNLLYRGGINYTNANANGVGEANDTAGYYKSKYVEGKVVEDVDHVPAWTTPVFTRLFDKPFVLIADK